MSIIGAILILVGFVLALVGGVIGIVQAFQESAVWGLLYLFVPFASLVFLIKFWSKREWLRKSFFMGLGGALLAGIGSAIVGVSAPPIDYTTPSGNLPDFEEPIVTTGDNGAVASYTAVNEPFRDAINLATAAANQTQTASTSAEWSGVAATWQDSIALLGAVPPSDPNYTTAQAKIADYSQNLAYAQTNANK